MQNENEELWEKSLREVAESLEELKKLDEEKMKKKEKKKKKKLKNSYKNDNNSEKYNDYYFENEEYNDNNYFIEEKTLEKREVKDLKCFRYYDKEFIYPIFSYCLLSNLVSLLNIYLKPNVILHITTKEADILQYKEQQKCLEQVVKNDGNIQKIGIIICLYTGIRIGEVCALKWEDVQFENAVLHIYKTVYRTKDFSKNNRKTKLIVKEPKSKHSVRYIPLGSTLLEYLKKYRQEDSDFILTGNSEKPLDPRTYQNQFYSYLKKCNIKKIKFHILRHTFATRWIENNCDVKSLSEILGHSSVTITMNTYVHSNFKLKQEGMKKLEENQEFLS